MPTLQTGALTTLARMKIFLGINRDAYDGFLTMAINQATGFISRYTKRTLARTTYTDEIYTGKDSPYLSLKNFPVASITSISRRNAADNTDSWEVIDSQYYHFDADSGVVTYMAGCFSSLPNHYKVTYAAGYLIDFANENTPASHTLPMELEYLCQKLVSAIFNTRKTEGLSSQKVGDLSVTINQTVFSSDEIKHLLDKFTVPTV